MPAPERFKSFKDYQRRCFPAATEKHLARTLSPQLYGAIIARRSLNQAREILTRLMGDPHAYHRPS